MVKTAKKDSKGKGSKGKKAKSKAVTVAGVKVPKNILNGEFLGSIITSPLARELAADALIAVAGVLAGNKGARDAVAKAGSDVAKAGANAASAAGDAAQTATGAVADVVAEAARRILPSSIVGESADDDKKGRDKAALPEDASRSGERKRKPREKHPSH